MIIECTGQCAVMDGLASQGLRARVAAQAGHCRRPGWRVHPDGRLADTMRHLKCTGTRDLNCALRRTNPITTRQSVGIRAKRGGNSNSPREISQTRTNDLPTGYRRWPTILNYRPRHRLPLKTATRRNVMPTRERYRPQHAPSARRPRHLCQ